MKKRFLTWKTALAATAVAIGITGTSLGTVEAYPGDGNSGIEYSWYNEHGNTYEYDRWAQKRGTYMTVCPDGSYMIVQRIEDGKIGVEYYTSNFKFKKKKIITSCLPKFGIFYETSTNYYLFTGQDNKSESNSVEVFRLTKFDRNWNELSHCSIYGANTYEAFSCGTGEITGSGDYLVIRTNHEMFNNGDGYHHQSNAIFEINTSTMKVTDSDYAFWDSTNTCGHVSHSFNQMTAIENGKVVAVDHGDHYPRSICLTQYSGTMTAGKFKSKIKRTDVLSFTGQGGDNDTGAELGGFEISSTNYLIAGLNTDTGYAGKTEGIFVSSVDKSTNKVTYHLIEAASSEEQTNPYLVKSAADTFWLIWCMGDEVHYTKIDKSGNKVGEIYKMNASLSDCEPVVTGNRLIWIVRTLDKTYTERVSGNWIWNNNLVFYGIDLTNPRKTASKTIYTYQNEWYAGYWFGADGKRTYSHSLISDVNEDGQETLNYKVRGSEEIKSYAKSWVRIDGRWRYVRSDDVVAKGEWNKGYWLNKSGYLTYKAKGSWKKDDTGWRYEDTSGWYATTWTQIDEEWYLFNKNGYMRTGWVKGNNTWYYLNGNGKMASQVWKRINGKWYYFRKDGSMMTGLTEIDGSTYYFNNDGAMQTGWLELEDGWRYFHGNGKMETKEVTIGKNTYTFDSKGICQNP